MNEQKEVKLGMTTEEVKEILGEPNYVKKEGQSTIFFYKTHKPYKERNIRFFNGVVVSIHIFGKEDGRYGLA